MERNVLSKFLVPLVLVVAFFAVWLVAASASDRPFVDEPPIEGTPSFLPFIAKPLPSPTVPPTPVPTVPQFIKTVALPGAQCPNSVFVNEVNDYVYIANNFSHNISFLQDETFVGNVLSGGQWPTRFTLIPESAVTFVTNLHTVGNTGPPTPLAEFHGMQLVRTYDQLFEGYSPLYNPINKYLYVTDLDSNIRVFDASTLPATFVKDINRDDGVQGWIKAITIDPATGLVYAASWDYAELYVIDGLEVTAVISTQAWGPDELLFDPIHNYIYVAGQEVENRPEGYPAYNITVFNAAPPHQFLGGFTTANSTHRLALDPTTGIVYSANPLADTVSVINGLQAVGNIAVGDFPYAIHANPNTGYVFVANTNSHTISILKGGALVTTIPSQGIRPYAIGVDSRDNTVYVANRGTEWHLACGNDASVTILR